MARTIRFKGSVLTLVGRALKVGAAAPPFKVTAQDLKEVSLSDFAGTIKVLTSFPSLDTPVCDLQVKEFNKAAAGFSAEVVVAGISRDLPFAQKRFCQEHEIKNALIFSDYRTGSFGINYGLVIKELNLLARAVVIVDKNDRVRYLQVVDELSSPPRYDEVLRSLGEVVKSPLSGAKEDHPSHCTPCEDTVAPLPREAVERSLARHRGWQLVEEKKLVKEFKTKDFEEARYALDLVAAIAGEQGHHPTLTLLHDRLKVTLTTHAAGGLTENDFIMARVIDEALEG